MVRVQQVVTIRSTPTAVLAFVMDIERYAEVDTKIAPVLWSRRAGDRLEFACRPKLAGLRQPTVVQHVRVSEPGRRIDIALAPLPKNRVAHAVARFAASVECEAVEGGVLVTRTLELRFAPWIGWLLEPLFRRRLPGEVADELRLAAAHLEAAPGSGPPTQSSSSASGAP